MAYQNIVSTGSIYKGRTGMWLYLFHRITGVALFGYLLLHIISTALILAGPEIYEGAEAIYKNFYFRIGEVGITALFVFIAIFVPTTYKMIDSYFELCLEKSSVGTTIVDCMVRPLPDWNTK